METSQKNSCFYQGRVYSEGEQIDSGADYRMVCKDGDWQDLDESSLDPDHTLVHFYH